MKPSKTLSIRVSLSTLAVAAVVVLATSLTATTPMSRAEQEVRDVMDLYFKGAATAEASYFEQAFDVENGHVKSVRRGEDGVEEVRITPIANAIEGWTRNAPEKSWGKVLNVDVVDDKLAHATVELLWRGTIYVDVMALYKVNDQWKIVNKTYVSRGRAE